MRSAEAVRPRFDYTVPVTVDELLAHARRQLARAPFRPSRREANLLLAHVLDWSEARILSRGETPVPAAAVGRLESLLGRRLTGEPIAYVLGEKEFYGRPFAVDSRVLIPRPETEHLIEAVLRLNLPSEPRILDIGTGSGCIAVTLAHELPDAVCFASDRSPAALAVARINIARHGVSDRIAVLCCDLATAVDPALFDVVVSNPPYVDPRDEPTLSIEVSRFEPHEALFAPDDRDSVVRRLLAELTDLGRGRHLLFEIGHDQVRSVVSMLDGSSFEQVQIRSDLAGLPRIVVARRK